MRTRASRDTYTPRSATQPRIMQPQQSTSAAAADPHATSIEQRTTEHIRTAVLASEQRITEQFLAASAALLAQLQQPTAAPALQIHISPPPPTRTRRRRVVRRPLSHLSNTPRPSLSTSPTTAKSSLPDSNVPHATSRNHVCRLSPTTQPAH
jgi:hypothetical protein